MNKIDLIIDALEKSINACKLYDRQDIQDGGTVYLEEELESSIKALAAARELKASEPVAWMLPEYGDVLSASEADGTGIYNVPLYTAPPRKPWVGLTGTEINHIFAANVGYPERMCLAIEAKLKEKNGG